MVRGWRIAAIGGGDAVVLARLGPDFGELARGVAAPHAWIARVGTDAALASLAAAALWVAAVWLALGLAAAAAAQLPGSAGRVAGGLARVVLPAVVRKVVAGSAGIGLLLAPIVTGSAQAAPSRAVLPAPTWPTTPSPGMHATAGPGPSRLPAPTWPLTSAPVSPTPTSPPVTAHATTGGHVHDRIRVHPGDSLWLLAAQRIGPHATSRQIATAWPRWYAANRAVIGSDPGHLVPGEVLHVPSAEHQETP